MQISSKAMSGNIMQNQDELTLRLQQSVIDHDAA
jgi:hypothetical protein